MTDKERQEEEILAQEIDDEMGAVAITASCAYSPPLSWPAGMPKQWREVGRQG